MNAREIYTKAYWIGRLNDNRLNDMLRRLIAIDGTAAIVGEINGRFKKETFLYDEIMRKRIINLDEWEIALRKEWAMETLDYRQSVPEWQRKTFWTKYPPGKA